MCATAGLAADSRAEPAPDRAAGAALLEPASEPIIQNRKYRLKWELALGASVLPSDAYTKQGGGSFSLTYHFNDLIAWEVLHAHGYGDWRSGLREQLEDNFGIAPQRFSVLRAIVDSNFVISPIYLKLSLVNRRLVYLQFFGLVGAGAGLVQGGEPEPGSGDPGRGPHVAVVADIGLGVRAWLSPRWSLRYELRQYISIDTATREVSPPFYMSLSAAVSLGGGR